MGREFYARRVLLHCHNCGDPCSVPNDQLTNPDQGGCEQGYVDDEFRYQVASALDRSIVFHECIGNGPNTRGPSRVVFRKADDDGSAGLTAPLPRPSSEPPILLRREVED